MIIDEINKANIEALKNKDSTARSIYSVAKNKILLESINKRESGQEITDDDVVKIIFKLVKELEEERMNFEKQGNYVAVENTNRQIELMSKFLPVMLTDEEIQNEIQKLTDKSIPSVMKYFKTNFNGRVDLKRVQEILKRSM